MTIKKVYIDVFAFLETNKNKKIETILPELIKMMKSKQSPKNFLTNEEGVVTHLFCYYHKMWESVEYYGSKKHSSSGFNSMCKLGVNQWTKQQRLFKNGEQSLLDDIVLGTLSVDEVQKSRETLELIRKEIEPRKDNHGFKTIEDIK